MARAAAIVRTFQAKGVWSQTAPAVIDRGAQGLSAGLPVVQQRLAALDLALDAIAVPAVMMSRSGQMVRANAVAHSLLRSEKRGLRRALAALVAMTVDASAGRSAARTPDPGWNVTPLGNGHAPVGYLAIRHGPPPQSQATHPDVLRLAGRCWRLTTRQGEVLELAARGLTNELIADTLGIGKGTVEFHLAAIFDKAGVSNRATLIVRAMKVGRQR